MLHCEEDKSLDECWFMPKMKGKAKEGISQADVNFDYEPFISTETSTQYLDIAGQNATQMNAAFEDTLASDSSNDYYTDTDYGSHERKKRNVNEEFIEITKIDTACPSKLRKLYESEGLYCSDLRNVNSISYILYNIHMYHIFFKM